MKKLLAFLVIFVILMFVFVYFFVGLDEERDVSGDPDIRGKIYSVSEDKILVAEGLEGDVDDYEGQIDRLQGNAIWFTVPGVVEIEGKKGETLSFNDRELGDMVEVWSTGVVLESYPAQATASFIRVVEEVPGFVSYESQEKGVVFDYPEVADLEYEDQRIKITYLGEESEEGTEITDGFTLFIDTKELEDSDLEEVAQQEFEQRTQVSEPVSEPENTEVNGLEVIMFKIEGGLGAEHRFLVFEKEEMAIITSEFIADPQEIGYKDVIKNIILSIEVLEDQDQDSVSSNGDNECYIGGCGGELCTDDPGAVSTCEYLRGADCLQEEGVSCESVDGECSWVLSEEAAQCFAMTEEEYGSGIRDSRIGDLFKKADEVLSR